MVLIEAALIEIVFDRDGFDVNYFNRESLHKDTKIYI